MIDRYQLEDLITEVLQASGTYSPAAVQLLLGTAAVESRLGTYIKQINGPALGIFQMEPFTAKDIWRNYLRYHPTKIADVHEVTGVEPMDKALCKVTPNALRYNIGYQVLMARYQYMRFPEPLPKIDSVQAQARYWKKYYNTSKGKGTIEKYIDAYFKWVND